jgi:dihydrofolate reductase
MAKLRVASFGVSLDGFGAGTDQGLENPLGVRGAELMQWFFPTRFWRGMQGQEGGETGVDNAMAAKGFDNVGAWILGRNMFGPVRGSWDNMPDWRGWWGEEPPYHCQVFVLTHYPRPPLAMQGTTFHFVTEGIEAALAQAKAAAGGKDVRLGGGAASVREYLQARLLDELHLAFSPVLLGAGEPVFAGLDLHALGYEVSETVAGERANHVFLRRRD